MAETDLRAKIERARNATSALRDAARNGTVIEFRQRDPLVIAIHDVLDLAEQQSAALAAVQQGSQVEIDRLRHLRTLWEDEARRQRLVIAELEDGALSAPKAPRPEAASQSLRGDTQFGRLRGAMAEELADVDINARMEEVRGSWASEVFDPPLWWRRGGEEWEPVYNAAVLMSYVLNAQRHGREFTVLRTQSPPSSVRPDADLEDGHLAAQANEPTWQPIATAPRGEELYFWIRPKTSDETYLDGSGRPIIGKFEPYLHRGQYGSWGALSMADFWLRPPPNPAPPGGLVDHLQGEKK